MARPHLPLGAWGDFTVRRVRPGVYRAWARYRDFDGQTRRVSATGSTKGAAERALREMLADRDVPMGEELTSEIRLSALAEYWLEHLHREQRIEASTIREYRRIVEHVVLPALGEVRLRELTTGRLDRFLLTVRETSVSRQRKAKVVVGLMLDLAVRHDALAVNPIRSTSKVRRPKTETRALTRLEVGELREVVRRWTLGTKPGPRPTNDMADIVDLMLGTGCRIGEILALRWSDIDIDGPRPTLTVTGTIKTEPKLGTYRKSTPKTDASVRTIALPAFAVETLKRRRMEEPPNDLDAVFVTRNGTWHQLANIERRWRAIREGTGYEWVTPHVFRKTVATYISEQVGTEQASRQLGHTTSQVTRQHYIAKPELSADHAELLEDFGHSRPLDPDES